MKYLGTSFSITLGAWRVRFSLDVEDAPEDRTLVMHDARARPGSRTAAERTPKVT